MEEEEKLRELFWKGNRGGERRNSVKMTAAGGAWGTRKKPRMESSGRMGGRKKNPKGGNPWNAKDKFPPKKGENSLRESPKESSGRVDRKGRRSISLKTRREKFGPG